MGEAAEQARGFHVTTTRKQVITAALPLQDHWLPLSNLDLLLPPLDVNVCFCYKKSLNITNTVAHETLKTALAETLVSYYAFAGEIVTNTTGEPEILCNNRGVDFVEASADVELRELNLYDPDESIGKLVPIKKHGVIAIQVTQLKCGSIVVGCTFDHRVADAYSMNMFLLSWAEISRSDVPISCVPSFRRSLLNPRRPLVIDSSIDQIFMPVTSLPPPQETTNPENLLTSRIYYIKADALDELQTLASSSKNGKRTKLESFSAFLWKLVAEQTAKDHPVPSKTSKLGIVVDGRRRLMEQENNTYFGNVLSIPFGGQRIDDLINKPLSWVTDEVHRFLERSATKEHFLNLIDWVETRRPTPSVSRIYSVGSDDGPAFVVSSGRSFPVTQVDYGWGSPVFGSYHFPWGGSAGYVMPMPSSVDDGDWMVYLHLTKGQLKFIEEEASHVFKPIDNDYLKI
ncbi:PREDICTED: shikimate O-hydroxycinnamoyltransferase-like [Camelina sativa]|uniref:Shikimate O-hydroxycinnamoyltransferase-like n=1 Tax=Camelina sativa TaxID=90675 RepID=A0ABM0SXE7_CAMSA|nr:PREDICTED: shikimate O-hydroxycinnamoyltransferase-like [Camelina sativa]